MPNGFGNRHQLRDWSTFSATRDKSTDTVPVTMFPLYGFSPERRPVCAVGGCYISVHMPRGSMSEDIWTLPGRRGTPH
jgi:hypothetical protein